ncbi:MAG: LysM domain-containing protein [Acidobacteriota bacterium]
MKKWACVAAVLMTVALAIDAAEPPPQPLNQQPDGHWTAWQPPAAPADATDVYIIQPGDTLWNLAQRFYGDPYLWPQLWERNQYILDAHWIYPGDPLRTGALAPTVRPGEEAVIGQPLEDGSALPPGALPADGIGDGGDPEVARAEELARRAEDIFTGRSELAGTEGPVPLGHESDIYCSGYIGDPEETFTYGLASSEYEFLLPTLNPQEGESIQGIYGDTDTQKYGLSVGDIAYVSGGRADGLAAGDQLTVVLPQELVSHPTTREVIGRYNRYLGRLRVLSVQDDRAIAEVTLACGAVLVGSRLKIFEPEPVPLRRMTPMRPVNFPASDAVVAEGANIVKTQDDLVATADGHVVFIDRGYEQDVAPGDIYTIYRQTRGDLSPVVLGELAILSVQKDTSVARIVRSRYTVYVGDRLILK